MVLAVDGGPFAGVLPGGQPQPETEEVFQRRMQLQGAMGRITVQVHRDADNGDMRHHQNGNDQLPDRQVKKTVVPHEPSAS
ncbi:hypothetical protein D3C80_1886880 [compost metagenome]